MYGLTRATTTLLGAALAGFLIYAAIEIVIDGETNTDPEYWSSVGLLAAAGLVMALSQLLGGWTKWGWPRISGPVFLLGFVPVLVVALWFVLAGQPEGEGWLRGDVLDWSDDLGIGGFVDAMIQAVPVIAFGTGLVFGFSFDTSGPRVRRDDEVQALPPEERSEAPRRDDEDETVVRESPRTRP